MAHLLIVELPGGNDGDILRAARERGDSYALLATELGIYRRQPALRTLLDGADALIEVPGFDLDEVQRHVARAHARRRFDAVLCLIDIRLVEAATLARRLGLAFLNLSSAALLRDKFAVRRRLERCGIAQPAFALAASNTDLRAAVARIGPPLVIKPADGYGSQQIVALRDAADLDPLLGPLPELLPCRADYGLGVVAGSRLIVERLLRGRFVGCDTLSRDGRHRLLGVHEKLMFEPPSFAIRGATFVPRAAQHAELEAHVGALLDAVGFDCGAAHVELMLTDAGPQLVEINPRLVGAGLPRLVDLALGGSVHHALIALHLGVSGVAPSEAPARCAALRWIAAPRAGTLEQLEFPAWHDAAVHHTRIFAQPGDAVRPPLENAERIGCVMVGAADRGRAEDTVERWIADARVHVQGRRTRVG